MVALADVYDALTSDRCYKKAYSHETAVTMILNGECGAFNPMLLDCLQEISARLKSSLPRLAAERSMKKNAQRLSSELLKKNELPRSDRAQRELNHAREMLTFFASCCGGVQFEYDTLSRSITVVDWSRPWRKSRTILDADNPDSMRLLRPPTSSGSGAPSRPRRPRTMSFPSACSCRSRASSTGTASGCTRSGRRSRPAAMSA